MCEPNKHSARLVEKGARGPVWDFKLFADMPTATSKKAKKGKPQESSCFRHFVDGEDVGKRRTGVVWTREI